MMGLKILEKIHRHAAVASGDFASICKGVEIPPLPAATARLIAEVNKPDPDPEKLVKVISASPELSVKVLQTINSARFALRGRVKTIRHACALLGLRQIKAIAVGCAMVKDIPKPSNSSFDHEAFWADCLLRALIAQSLARRSRAGREAAEEAFTAMLLADIALPVLLGAWEEYYAPVIAQWRDDEQRLSELERETFRWDHAQAGAWILQSWGFAEEMVCFVGAHNLSPDALEELGLESTVALPMSVASLFPSALRRPGRRVSCFLERVSKTFSIEGSDLAEMAVEIRADLDEACTLFGLRRQGNADALGVIARSAGGDSRQAAA
jgi:HD-like signal output (HDOD) protein